MSDAIYAPLKIVEVKFKAGGSGLKVGVNVPQMVEFLLKHKNEAGWVNLFIAPKSKPDGMGRTHSCKLDTWRPPPKPAEAQPEPNHEPGHPPF